MTTVDELTAILLTAKDYRDAGLSHEETAAKVTLRLREYTESAIHVEYNPETQTYEIKW